MYLDFKVNSDIDCPFMVMNFEGDKDEKEWFAVLDEFCENGTNAMFCQIINAMKARLDEYEAKARALPWRNRSFSHRAAHLWSGEISAFLRTVAGIDIRKERLASRIEVLVKSGYRQVVLNDADDFDSILPWDRDIILALDDDAKLHSLSRVVFRCKPSIEALENVLVDAFSGNEQKDSAPSNPSELSCVVDNGKWIMAENVLDELGLTVDEAVNIFLAQVVIQRGIPFPIVAYNLDDQERRGDR